MKLTKAQRLFIKAGEAQSLMKDFAERGFVNPTAKYRKFRKGDIVRLKAYNGRKPYDFWHKQTIEHFGAKLDTVLADELDSGNVDIFQDAPIDELTVRVHSCHLELVTPVEELGPYFISEGAGIIELYKGTTDEVVKAWFYDDVKAGVEALAAAEAECARLNAEWRKEQE